MWPLYVFYTQCPEKAKPLGFIVIKNPQALIESNVCVFYFCILCCVCYRVVNKYTP